MMTTRVNKCTRGPIMKFNDQNREATRRVILSAAKNLNGPTEILRCAQNDTARAALMTGFGRENSSSAVGMINRPPAAFIDPGCSAPYCG